MLKPINLTPREREVAELVAANLTNAQIAARLGVEEETVKAHVWHILSKMGAENRHQVRELLSKAAANDKQPAEFSDDDVIEILWRIHALLLRKGSPGTAKIINRALLRIRLHPNGDGQ